MRVKIIVAVGKRWDVCVKNRIAFCDDDLLHTLGVVGGASETAGEECASVC